MRGANGAGGASGGRQRGGNAAALQAAHAAAMAEATHLAVSGIDTPVRILSGASLLQLKQLSAAFQLCPNPNPLQIAAVAKRVGVSPEKLETWFQSRRTLHEWVQQQPHMQPHHLARMFYPEAAEAPSQPPSHRASHAPTPHQHLISPTLSGVVSPSFSSTCGGGLSVSASPTPELMLAAASVAAPSSFAALPATSAAALAKAAAQHGFAAPSPQTPATLAGGAAATMPPPAACSAAAMAEAGAALAAAVVGSPLG